MPRLGLALSGGGFRATLFHLGVVRYLKDAGKLQQVTDIASVSGGSILAAHLVLNWDRYTADDRRFDEAANELIQFVQFDLRNHIVRRMPFQFPLRMLAKLTRRNFRSLTPNAILEHYYRTRLLGDRCLYELPEQPALHMLATNVSNGGLSVFNRRGLFIQQRSNDAEIRFEHIPAKIASIPRVVGASSAFPGFFPPVEITAADLGVRDGEFPTEYFTDGGVFDNLGIRAFSWLKFQGEEFDQVIVSDAGKPFQILSESALSILGQSVRATDILWDRVWQLERENFGTQPGFMFVPITEHVSEEEGPTLHPVIQSEVKSIRTDLDHFSDEEINALAQHGYEVARKIYRQSFGEQEVPTTGATTWAPIPEKRLPASDGKPATRSLHASTSTAVSRRLRGSAARRIWSTLFDFRDWPTYIYVALLLFVFGYLPFKVYELYSEAQVLKTVNLAITQGDPDINRVLELINEDPTTDWEAAPVQEIPEATEFDLAGIEMMSHTRIIDLRRWQPTSAVESNRGRIYMSDRVEVRLMEDYQGDHRLVLSMPLAIDNIIFRQSTSKHKAIIRKVTKPIEEAGLLKTVYEFEYDLRGVSIGERATFEMEMLMDLPEERTSAQFTMRLKTDLVSMWMLFPEDRPYRSYRLVKYPLDRSSPPAVLDSRYQIDHPYGSLIGWSVVNPKIGNVYECRWKLE